MQRAAIVGIGGLLGAVGRYLVTGWFQALLGSTFPWGTALVNIVGSFFVGFIVTLGTETLTMATETRLFLVVGILGGFTTFSSFGYETMRLAQSGSYLSAVANVALNVILGLIAVFLGIAVARML